MTPCQGGYLTFQDHRRMNSRGQWTARLPVTKGGVSGLALCLEEELVAYGRSGQRVVVFPVSMLGRRTYEDTYCGKQQRHRQTQGGRDNYPCAVVCRSDCGKRRGLTWWYSNAGSSHDAQVNIQREGETAPTQ